MMPPTNRLGGALQIASQIAGIVSAFPSSDIKLKENIEEVGVSPDGYKINELF